MAWRLIKPVNCSILAATRSVYSWNDKRKQGTLKRSPINPKVIVIKLPPRVKFRDFTRFHSFLEQPDFRLSILPIALARIKPCSHSMQELNTPIPTHSFPSKLAAGTSKLWLMVSCAATDPVAGWTRSTSQQLYAFCVAIRKSMYSIAIYFHVFILSFYCLFYLIG